MNLQVNPHTFIRRPKFGDDQKAIEAISQQWTQWRKSIIPVHDCFVLFTRVGGSYEKDELMSVLRGPDGQMPQVFADKFQVRLTFPYESIIEARRRYLASLAGDKTIASDGSLEWEEPILSQQKVFHQPKPGDRP